MRVDRSLRVGFIGLGRQGGSMARRIIGAGVPTTLWARRRETLEAYRNTAAQYAASPAEVGAAVDLACVCVVDDAGVIEIVAGPNGLLSGMSAGGMIAVQSTVHPNTCVRLAEQAAAQDVTLIDAPVSGGGSAAEKGRLLVMVGGDLEAVERARPVFQTYGDPVVHLGPVGAGQRAKLINNLLLTANLAVAESAFALAQQFDVDPSQLKTVLAHGSGNSYAVSILRGPDFGLAALGEHAGSLLLKDIRLVVDLAEAEGVKTRTVLEAADVALEALGYPR